MAQFNKIQEEIQEIVVDQWIIYFFNFLMAHY